MIVVRIFKGVWFFSLLATVAVLLYTYASFPETLQITEGDAPQSVSRNSMFYAVIGLLSIFNAMVFLVNRFMAEGDSFFQTWFYGLVIFFNLFILVSIQFVSVYNSNEKFDYDNIGYIIYGSVSLMVIWASLWPLNHLLQRFRPKRGIVQDTNS